MFFVKFGYIVNIVSMVGFIVISKVSVYGVSKFVVVGFLNVFCLELVEKNVYVISVNFGLIKIGFFV